MHEWGCAEAVADAELLVSELVTNAVLHARSGARVDIEHVGTTVRVAVCDDSPALPRVRHYGPEAVTGRGMLLVQRIADRWGVEPCDDGKCVWFEFPDRLTGSAVDREKVGES